MRFVEDEAAVVDRRTSRASHSGRQELTIPTRRRAVPMPSPGNGTTTATARPTRLNKLPQITAFFWIAKILTTGFGEAASDALSHAAGAAGVVATGLALAGSLVAQLRATRYIPWLYWATVALVGVFGTMAADGTHELGIPLGVSSAGYLAITVAIFVIWYRVEGTLS